MKLKSTLLLLSLAVAGLASGQTNVPSVISTNQTWNSAGSPYIISQNTVIDNGVKVTVDPGVIVRTSARNLTMVVDGEFQAIGTQANPITIDSLEISFTRNSVDYDAASGAGAHFSWCNFTGDETTYKAAVKTQSTGIKVDNCRFEKHYYGVNNAANSNDSLDFIIDSCYFGGRSTSNYPVRGFGTTSTSIVTNCTFDNTGYFYFYGKLHFENNDVIGFQQFQHMAYFNALVKCNRFKHGKSLSITFYSVSNVANYTVEYNTFDSMGNGSIKVHRQTGSSTLSTLKFHHNNFLNPVGSNLVAITGMNSNLTTSDRIDFENNYWGTTDTAIIDGWISDYSDDINFFGKVDYRPFLTSKHVGCDTSSCDASYYLALDTSTLYNLYVVNNSTGTTSNTSYLWSFGDGDSSTQKHPTHKYSTFGLYELCLTITDTAANCFSTYCDSIGLDSNGKLLKADGFTITVLDEDDLVGVRKIEEMGTARAYPNPTQGKLTLELSETVQHGVSVTVRNALGQMVLDQHISHLSGNKIDLDLSGNTTGLYTVQVTAGGQSKVFKIALNN
ncbi:MAG: T9SS type A sorting domain-containing protein [Bacteroidia bacterium]|nr:T9SS type A sorting domain-containing protein [Bacteroidia bacterium]